MGQHTQQKISCKKRDVAWLTRIHNRARDDETRDPETYAAVLEKLKYVTDVLQREIDLDALEQRRQRSGSGGGGGGGAKKSGRRAA
jgi:hypothetical protein